MSLSVLAASPGDLLATHFSREKRVFCISKTVFKFFQLFPLIFVTIHYLLHFSLNWNWPKPSSNFISASFLLESSRKGMGFLYLTSFSMFWVCFSCFYEWFWGHYVFVKCHGHSRVCFILMIVHYLRVSVLTLLLMFVCCLGFVQCFMIVVISFISCLWYSITLFIIWIHVIMLSGHLIMRYWC